MPGSLFIVVLVFWVLLHPCLLVHPDLVEAGVDGHLDDLLKHLLTRIDAEPC